MKNRLDLRIVVAGAGAVGTTAAVLLARAGARVIVADPSGPGDSAPGSAAGMLAPAFESPVDAASPPLSLLRRALALWPELAASMGLAVNRSGAMAVGAPHE
ncbi:MAG: FAD-dependent oxidoreductase, partial [Caulobacteraceae bacterium]